MRAVCSSCGAEYSTDEYEVDRFCRSCGGLLKLKPSDKKYGDKIEDEPMEDNLFIYDVGLASTIGSVLHNQFQSKTGYFTGHVMPEYIMPDIPSGSRELALYFTYVISIDYQTDAHKLWRNARNLFPKNKTYFEPTSILSTPDDELQEFIRSLGARYPNNGASAWKTISGILLSRYDGDPRNITREPLTSKELWKRLDRFPYLRGKKIGTLYLRVMGDLGLFKISDLDKLDVAVDVQVSRFTFYTGILKPKQALEGCVHNPPIRPSVEKLWRAAALNVGCAPWHLDQPIWVIFACF